VDQRRELTRQRQVFDLAIGIYEERDQIRQGLWKDYTARDQLHQAKIKIERCLRSLEIGGEDQEAHILKEVPDIINYVAFAHRLLSPDGKGA
jgi:hypothetical protein